MIRLASKKTMILPKYASSFPLSRSFHASFNQIYAVLIIKRFEKSFYTLSTGRFEKSFYISPKRFEKSFYRSQTNDLKNRFTGQARGIAKSPPNIIT